MSAGVVEDVVGIDHELGSGGSIGREREQFLVEGRMAIEIDELTPEELM